MPPEEAWTDVWSAIRAGLSPGFLRNVTVVPEQVDGSGEVELRAAPNAVAAVRFVLAKAGWPSRVREDDGPRCGCCAVSRFAGADRVTRCARCPHFFEMHAQERVRLVLPVLSTGAVSVLVGARHDLVADRGGPWCSRCGHRDDGDGLMQPCEPQGQAGG